MHRILIIEDHPLSRGGINNLLTEELGNVRIQETGKSAEALDLVRTEPWDTVVLDIGLPGRNGIELLNEIKRQKPGLLVLVLSMHPEEQYAMQMFNAGADGDLPETADHSEVVSVLKRVLEGRDHVAAKFPHQHLSEREIQVLRHVVTGKGPTEIAQELSLGVSTVSTYRARILKKMHMKTDADLIRYAVQHGLLR
jgi:DNA-binding NarL/FixJ family response regulator